MASFMVVECAGNFDNNQLTRSNNHSIHINFDCKLPEEKNVDRKKM